MSTLAVLALLAANAGEPSVRATASKDQVTVGERFTVDLAAKGPAGTTWEFPGEVVTEQVEMTHAASVAAPAPDAWRYEAAVFALDEAEVPAITVKYRLPDGTAGEVATQPLKVKVGSVLPRDPKEQTLADIQGPRDLAIGRPFWIALGTLSALLLAFACWLWRRRRKPAAEVPTTPGLTADVEAARALDALEQAGLVARGEFREFYIRLAEIGKRYLERRLQAPVLEMTTAETVGFLRDHPQARSFATALREVIEGADRVKFARGTALAEEAERHFSTLRQLIPALEERLRPKPAPKEPAA